MPTRDPALSLSDLAEPVQWTALVMGGLANDCVKWSGMTGQVGVP